MEHKFSNSPFPFKILIDMWSPVCQAHPPFTLLFINVMIRAGV